MKKLIILSILLGVIVLAQPTFANSTSKFKQFIIPLDCTLDIVDTGVGNPYALVQPEDCQQPNNPPVNPNEPSRSPYYPKSVSLKDYNKNITKPSGTGGESRGFDFWPLSFVDPDWLVLIAALVFGFLLGQRTNKKRRRKHDKIT